MKEAKGIQRLVWAAVFCLSGVLTGTAQAKNNLTCTIVDQTGNPLVKQEVVLTSNAGGKEQKKKTNDQGLVEFKGLDDGSYHLRGEIPGYVMSQSAPIELSGNKTHSCTHTIASVEYANALFQEIQQLLTQKKFAEAEERASKAAAVLPNESGVHYLLAVARAYQGREAGAVESMKIAAQLEPEKYGSRVAAIHLAALDVLAKEAEAKKDYDGMVKKFEQMLTVADDKATVYFNWALAYARIPKYPEAMSYLDKAIALKPQDAEIQQMKIR